MLKSLTFVANPFCTDGLLIAALVFLLLACKMTVATGTLSGLVFYANIVGDNRALFLSKKYPVLSVFIACLNLDFGIETCFYDRLDAYSKTWLQFGFPVYSYLVASRTHHCCWSFLTKVCKPDWQQLSSALSFFTLSSM